MSSNLALYQILLMMEHAEVTEIRWDGTALETEPPGRGEELHGDLKNTIRLSKPFTLSRPGETL